MSNKRRTFLKMLAASPLLGCSGNYTTYGDTGGSSGSGGSSENAGSSSTGCASGTKPGSLERVQETPEAVRTTSPAPNPAKAR